MDTLEGKVAFVTGGASGIGLGMAKAFLAAGMKVVIADVRHEALQAGLSSLTVGRDMALGIQLDVTDAEGWARARDRAIEAFGKVDVLCSNAGVNIVGPTQAATAEDWAFCMGVNLGGAINAVRTFAPLLQSNPDGGHIVITASVSGLFTGPGTGVYATSKYALVGLAESLRADLAPHGVGVSVLCPGPVKSELFESTAAVRPSELAASGAISVVPDGVSREHTPIFATAMAGDEVGRRVVVGIRRNDLYIMTHPEIGTVLESRAAALLASLPDEPIDHQRVDATQGLLDDSLYREQTARGSPKP